MRGDNLMITMVDILVWWSMTLRRSWTDFMACGITKGAAPKKRRIALTSALGDTWGMGSWIVVVLDLCAFGSHLRGARNWTPPSVLPGAVLPWFQLVLGASFSDELSFKFWDWAKPLGRKQRCLRCLNAFQCFPRWGPFLKQRIHCAKTVRGQ